MYFGSSRQGGNSGDPSRRSLALLHLLAFSAAEWVCGREGGQPGSTGLGHQRPATGPWQRHQGLFEHILLRPSWGRGRTRPATFVCKLRTDLHVQTAPTELERTRRKGWHGNSFTSMQFYRLWPRDTEGQCNRESSRSSSVSFLIRT